MMKKLFVLLILIIGTHPSLFSQEYQYVPFPDSGAIWSEVFYPEHSEGEIVPEIYERFALTGEDTLMNELHYKKLYLYYNSVFNKNESTCIGGIREDSLKKIYYKGERIHSFKPIDNEIILYDFSLEIGDTIYYFNFYNILYRLIVEDIDTIQIGNSLRKKFTFNHWRSKWIEGIGSTRGLLFADRGDFFGPTIIEDNDLICFFQNDTLLYHSEWFSDCFPFQTNSIKVQTTTNFKVYPNPVADNTILFEWDNNKIESIDIYAINGKLIANINVIDKCRIEYSTIKLQKGVYFYKATTPDRMLQTGKFVIP